MIIHLQMTKATHPCQRKVLQVTVKLQYPLANNLTLLMKCFRLPYTPRMMCRCRDRTAMTIGHRWKPQWSLTKIQIGHPGYLILCRAQAGF